MAGVVRVYARRGRPQTDALRNPMPVDNKSSKESFHTRLSSRHRLSIAAFNEPLYDFNFSRKEFHERIRKLLLKKQQYRAPVFDPNLAHACPSLKKDAVRQKEEKPVTYVGNTDHFHVVPEETGIPYELRIPEFSHPLRCSGDGIDVIPRPKATRSLLVVCPRVPPILRYLGTDQAALYMWCQSDGVSQFIELRQGELIPGLYARVEVPEGVELKFIYCVRLNDGEIVATDPVVQLTQNRSLEASREVYYVMPKLVPVDSSTHMFGGEDNIIEEEEEQETSHRLSFMRRLLGALRRLIRRNDKSRYAQGPSDL